MAPAPIQLHRHRPTTAGLRPAGATARHAGLGSGVLIVVMPWAPPYLPSLGPALIRSVLERDGIACDILYGNLVFSRVYDGDAFIERELAKVPMSEIAFAPYYFDTPREVAAETLRHQVLGLVTDADPQTTERFTNVVSWAGECLDRIVETTPWERYDIVGFSVMMQQTVAALALAKRIKAVRPAIRTVFGGPNVARPMGPEMMRCFPEIDYVVEGEADATITPLVDQIRNASDGAVSVPGVLYRDAQGGIRDTGPAVPFHALDSLPVTDFTAYFDQIAALGLTHIHPYIPFETSRGCWWGEKHHCTFCGIDDTVMTFRSKSPATVLNEVRASSARHHTTDFFAVDSIIDHRFYRRLLPEFARLRHEQGLDFSFFFECKSNIRREHVQLFKYGGVSSVQPGLESFSDHVLELMDKGTTGARQVQCLKLLAECDVVANWNLIYANPGERVADYDETLTAIPFLYHLPPLHVEGLIPMQVSRFAPYHSRPNVYGIRNLRPMPHYRHIFPKPEVDLDKVGYYFDYDHPDQDNAELKALHLKLQDAVELWRRCYRRDALLQFRGPGFVIIVDRRVLPRPDGTLDDNRDLTFVLDGVWADIFTACDEVRQQVDLVRAFASVVSPEEAHGFVDRMVDARLIYRSASGQLLNLPLLQQARERYQPPVDLLDEACCADVSSRGGSR